MKPLQNNMLEALSSSAPKYIVNAIAHASDKTGVDFSYLLQQAQVESSFRPELKAKTSSATGLYQFIESTWMNMVERFGDEFDIDTEGKSEADILEMRKNPEAASFMAAKFAAQNQRYLETHYGGDIGSTELYFAHFMGRTAQAISSMPAQKTRCSWRPIFSRVKPRQITMFSSIKRRANREH